ncbi:MAG: hypothetical protein ACRDJU_15515, partial [Actinomycetota bacterium]
MIVLLAALAAGTAVYFAAGFVTGQAPRLHARARVPGRSRPGRRIWLLQAGTELSPAQFIAGSLVAGLAMFALLALV